MRVLSFQLNLKCRQILVHAYICLPITSSMYSYTKRIKCTFNKLPKIQSVHPLRTYRALFNQRFYISDKKKERKKRGKKKNYRSASANRKSRYMRGKEIHLKLLSAYTVYVIETRFVCGIWTQFKSLWKEKKISLAYSLENYTRLIYYHACFIILL